MKDAPTLRRIPPTDIKRNPDNPRLIFRDEDMDQLIESISQVGVLVPLTVYRDDNQTFQLLDGERRWRAARKLNLRDVPAIVQRKPERLENILRMFNIHNVRTEWDQLASAIKLGDVIRLIRKETGHDPTTTQLASLTGLKPGAVRRLLDLLALPEEHKNIILEELRKPQSEQRLTEDFFFELRKAVKTIHRYEADFFEEVPEKVFANSLIEKYKEHKIPSIVQFRAVSRIARGQRAGVSRRRVRRALTRLALDPDYTIEKAYESSVEHPLWEQDLSKRIVALRLKIEELGGEDLSDDIVQQLTQLAAVISRYLK